MFLELRVPCCWCYNLQFLLLISLYYILYNIFIDLNCTDELMSPGKYETCICGYARSEFICWAFWITLMRTNFMLVCLPQAIWQSSAPCLEHSCDISCSLFVHLSCTDESWEGENTRLHIYIYIYIYTFNKYILIYLYGYV